MPKDTFNKDNISTDESKTRYLSDGSANKRRSVDINKLLNRVKIDKKKETKKKIILLGFGILILGLTGIFVSI
ncbi:hypothetical protein N8745_02105 [Candidatus Pelagibacter sp.]|nr:hypothetical protein [Candidatus Pelagibacter sp.]